MSIVVKLQAADVQVLAEQLEASVADSPAAALFGKLQGQTDAESGELSLSEDDLQAVQAYVAGANLGETSVAVLTVLKKIVGQPSDVPAISEAS